MNTCTRERGETARGWSGSRGLALGLMIFLFGADLAFAQDPDEPVFSGAEQVVAIDLVVDVRNRNGKAPVEVTRDDITVLEGDVELPVVGVAPLGKGPQAEPWTVVLYFDLELASTATVNAAGLALAEVAEALTDLGAVEVVVAAPQPRSLIIGTRDANTVEGALSRIVLEREARNAVVALRQSVVAEIGDYPELDPGEVAASAIEAEEILVQAANDRLLGWIADRPTAGPKALFLVRDGYDLDPSLFYRRALEGAGGVGSGVKVLGASTTDLARVLAGYGWPAFVLSFSEIGGGTAALNRKFDEFRRKGLYGEKSEDVAMGSISVPIGRKGKEKEAEQQAPRGPVIGLVDPAAPLDIVVGETGGERVTGAERVPQLVSSLSERMRVTFQVSRRADGRLRPIVVRAAQRGLEVTAPGWIRSATPQVVAEARVRRILDGDFDEGDLAMTARYRAMMPAAESPAGEAEGSAATRSGELSLSLDLAAERPRPSSPEQATLRVTLAHGREGAPPTVSHQLLEDQDLTGASWQGQVAVEASPDDEYLIVIVEELGSGAWGSRVLEL